MMVDENVIGDYGLSQSSEPPLTHAPLGEVLLAARNAKKMTQKDVSNSLRISIKQITALETDDFALLPEAMITRGFIRNYARLLEIDAEPLLASYRAQMPDKAPNNLNVHSSVYEVVSGKDSQPWLIYILSSILVLLFLLAWLFYVDYMPKPAADAQPQSVALSTVPTEVVALPEVALPAAERQAGASLDASTLEELTSATSAVEEDVATSNIVSPVPPNKQLLTPSSALDSNTLKANTVQTPETQSTEVINSEIKTTVKLNPSLATKKVTVTVDEQTWVSVSDQSGIVIYEKLLEAGSADGFDGEPPFKVLVGNAKATKLTFLGKPLDLTGYTKNNVARLVLQ